MYQEGIALNRGQITVEALLVYIIAVSLLLIASGAILHMQNAQAGIAERGILKKQAGAVAEYANEVCILGEGNARAVPLHSEGMALEIEGGVMFASLGKAKYSAKILCPAKVLEGEFSKAAYIWHAGDGIVISPSPRK